MRDPHHHTLLISTCGTSLLTNGVEQELRNVLNFNSNHREGELSSDDRARCEARLSACRAALMAGDLAQAKKMSAELNGALACFGGATHRTGADQHIIIATDTWLGQQTAQLVADWLNAQGARAQVRVVKDLQTRSLEGFREATSALAKWAAEELRGWQARGYKVVFNLTGGFKSVNGLLQSLGMIYADEVCYLFDDKRVDLLRIPRLPVRMDTASVVRQHFSAFRTMGALHQPMPLSALAEVPESMLSILDDQALLSFWGDAAWAEHARAIYEEGLLPSPHPRIVYGPKLAKSIEGQPGDRLRTINMTIDDLTLHMLSDGKHNPSSLDYKSIKGGHKGSSHECDLWASHGGYRLFLHHEDDPALGKRYVLDTMHTGLH